MLSLSDEIAEGGRAFVFDDFDSSKNEEVRDTVAESIYALIGEVFDMRGVFRWLRKSLMAFVQITYGGSINRQIQDTVTWLSSEQMVLRYLHSFKKAFWTNDERLKPDREDMWHHR
jgi:sorting nexin-25